MSTEKVWRDKHGDVWTEGDDGLMHTPETRPFPREHIERKWGPLRPITPMRPTCEMWGCALTAVGIGDIDGDEFWLCDEHRYPAPRPLEAR